MGTEGLGQQLQAQFAAQLEALAALQAGKLPVDSTVLAACRGRVPAAAVSAGGAGGAAFEFASDYTLSLLPLRCWMSCSESLPQHRSIAGEGTGRCGGSSRS